jgi:hypothetical protein
VICYAVCVVPVAVFQLTSSATAHSDMTILLIVTFCILATSNVGTPAAAVQVD